MDLKDRTSFRKEEIKAFFQRERSDVIVVFHNQTHRVKKEDKNKRNYRGSSKAFCKYFPCCVFIKKIVAEEAKYFTYTLWPKLSV